MPTPSFYETALFEEPNEGGAGGTGDTGGDKGGDADNGGDGTGDEKSADNAAAILTGGTGKTDDNLEKDDATQKTADDKTGDDADDKTGDDDKGAADDDKDAVVPEGDYDFTMPEGVELDSTLAERMSPIMKELGITQGQANKLAAELSGHIAQQATAQAEGFVKQVNDWTATSMADKELGGTDAKWKETVALANAAIDKVGTPEFTAMLGQTGVSNHPEMIRVMLRVARALGEDNLSLGDTVDTSEVPQEESWYGKTTPSTKKG